MTSEEAEIVYPDFVWHPEAENDARLRWTLILQDGIDTLFEAGGNVVAVRDLPLAAGRG